MQIAIRRALPTARQQLARPQRLGLPLTTHLRIRARAQRPFSSTPQHSLRNNDDTSAIPIELTEGVEKDVEASKEKDVTQPEPAEEGAEKAAEGTEGKSPTLAEEVSNVMTAASGGAEKGPELATRPPGRPPGSKGRRMGPPKPKAIPRPNIPDWFTERNVVLREHVKADKMVVSTGSILAADEVGETPAETTSEPKPVVDDATALDEPVEKVATEETPVTETLTEEPKAVLEKAPKRRTKKTVQEPVLGGSSTPESEPARQAPAETEAEPVAEEALESESAYRIHETVWREVKSTIRTGLILPKQPHIESLAASKSHVILHVPKKGGVYYLDALVDKIALETGADLVRIDAQDMAEIAGDYLGDTQAASESDLSSVGVRALGYDTQISEPYQEGSKDETYDPDLDRDESYEEDSASSSRSNYDAAISPDASRFLPPNLQNLLRSSSIPPITVTVSAAGVRGNLPRPSPEKMNERKMDTLLRYLIDAPGTKRQKTFGPSDTPSDAPTLIHVRDYRELDTTVAGHAMLKNLHNIVQDLRKSGERILIIGTSSAEENLDTFGVNGEKIMQYQSEEAVERTIIIPPFRGFVVDTKFQQDRAARTREINVRHLRDIIRRRSGVNADSAALVVADDWHMHASADTESIIPGISTSVWDFDRVHRIATIALGGRPAGAHELTINDIASAAKLAESADSIKTSWLAEEYKTLESRADEEATVAAETKPKVKEYSKHEKKFLSRVINPNDIKTTFDSVRAPPETIESMKILTSMSLIRPEAFKYGVLASDRIPGVLLYGPPGTGKTLLARAVAKESGATVLEVSGADIEDMYVGESEKNVKALFSLAKKLSPCVVFIDEADAIFNSRQDTMSRSSRRETINQFLKEWADMTDTAFIMLATNRPFDLDDAVLRRLPRRLLIDLPTAEDRLHILQIHLQGETLADDVDLKKISETTQLHSGSDLKNICVSAALECVREENAEFAKTGKYPERRTLAKRHFDKAMKEVTPSITDDMKSLVALRTFDEKYGERAGKKKPKKSWGFEQGQDEAVKRGEWRVRMD